MDKTVQFRHPDDPEIQASPEELRQLLRTPAWAEIVRHFEQVQKDIYTRLLSVSDAQQLGALQGEGNLVRVLLGDESRLSLPEFLAEQAEMQLELEEDG